MKVKIQRETKQKLDNIFNELTNLGYWLDGECIDKDDNCIYEFRHSTNHNVNIVILAKHCEACGNDGDIELIGDTEICPACKPEWLRLRREAEMVNARDAELEERRL